jgi:antibiotic biosynthesis monooxygenase (ABM) superfamily enzyme
MSVSIVTQTCVIAGKGEAFARWQGKTSEVISGFPGFIEQRLIPPNPPLQVDWVILQRFATLEDARRWLASPERVGRMAGATHMLVGRDDVHIVQEDDTASPQPAAVTTILSTRVKPGQEAAYLLWLHRIESEQSKAKGLLGYRFEPAIPGVQESHVAVLRFDTEANLNRWLESPERKKLIDEAAPLTEEFHTRTARAGFEQWFRDALPDGAPPPAAWKVNMIVLLTLYPVVFLWSIYIGLPFVAGKYQMNYPVALFIGNVFSVAVTGVLVPWTAGRLTWWLAPAAARRTKVNILGAIAMLVAYAAMVFVFWKFF